MGDGRSGLIAGHTLGMGTALMTDLYELTMLDAALQSGVASRRSCFEVFARRLPPGRGYGVVAGPVDLPRCWLTTDSSLKI